MSGTLSTPDEVLTSAHEPAAGAQTSRVSPAYQKVFHEKLVTGEQALKLVKSGDTVYVHPGCACPERLLQALVARREDLENVRVIHIMTMGRAEYVNPGMERHFRHIALFTGKNVRGAINEGRADYVPVFLSEIPRLFYSNTMPVKHPPSRRRCFCRHSLPRR